MTRALSWALRNLPLLFVAGVAVFLVLKYRALEADNARLRSAADAGVVAELAKRQAEDRHAVSVLRAARAPVLPEIAALRAELAREAALRRNIEERLAATEAASEELRVRGTASDVAAALRARGLASAVPARRPR